MPAAMRDNVKHSGRSFYYDPALTWKLFIVLNSYAWCDSHIAHIRITVNTSFATGKLPLKAGDNRIAALCCSRTCTWKNTDAKT